MGRGGGYFCEFFWGGILGCENIKGGSGGCVLLHFEGGGGTLGCENIKGVPEVVFYYIFEVFDEPCQLIVKKYLIG